jgi:hypothetical protein
LQSWAIRTCFHVQLSKIRTMRSRQNLTRNRPGPDAASSLLEAGKVWGCGRDRTPRRERAGAGNRAGATRRLPLLTKLAAFTSVGRKIAAMSLKGYCKGGREPGLRRRESSRRSGPPLSGLRIQSLTKAPRTPLLQDFKGVKKSDRCTRITSS